MQTPMRSSGTEFPASPQGVDGAGQHGMPGRRAFFLAAAVLGILVVAGGIVALRQSEGEDVGARPGTSDNDAPSVEPVSSSVTDVEADPKPFAVRLSWTAPEGELEGIVVLRDGVRVGRAEPADTTFVDDSALPATRYTYVVQSVHDGSFLRSETIRVKTPPASLSLAQLDGVYAIDARNTSHFGLSGVVDNLASGWRFSPVCRQGPCDVTWKDVQGNPLSGRLEHTGVHYEGTGSSEFAKCGNVSTNGTLTLRFEVVRAESVRDAWRASKLVGTLVERYPAQLGCVAAGIDYDITAKLIA